MEETRDATGPAEQGGCSASRWTSDVMETFGSVSLAPQDDKLSSKGSPKNLGQDELSSQTASQILWSTGMLSGPIPNGFYSVIPERQLKELFDTVPTLDELHTLEAEGFKAEVILVDAAKDKKLTMLKQLIVVLFRGLNSNPPAMIKKIAALVSDVSKRQNVESPARAAPEETSYMLENQVIQMLGQIRHGSCRSRAILFKVLADTVGLESKLVVGLPNDGTLECVDPHKHMSVIVVLNSMELLVDLMRFPGQLIPLSTRAMFMTHVSAAGESYSAENDSCDSPLEPNSPLYGYSDRLDPDSAEKDESLQLHKNLEGASNVLGPAMRNLMLQPTTSLERKLSSSHSEPNIATTFWRRSGRKVIAEQRTASSSPEHPSFQARRRSMLGGDQKSLRDYSDDMATSRSDGVSSTPETRILRRRSISITPEIGDDIVRAVRAMNETLKQHRLLKEQGNDMSYSYSTNDRSSSSDNKNEINCDPHGRDEISGGRSVLFNRSREQMGSHKAISLPTSPHEYRNHSSERSATSNFAPHEESVSTWNKVLESLTFNDKPLLPYQEWHIDYSELTVGIRVGIVEIQRRLSTQERKLFSLSHSRGFRLERALDQQSMKKHLISDFENAIRFFGEVFRGTWNGTDVAIKVFLEQDLTAENMEDFCNEISILSRLRHPNVILFLGACTRPPRLSMVTEYMEMGSLFYLVHLSGQKKKLSWRRRLKMLRDICRGLMCLHRTKIIHCDLKSANCLVNKHWTVKICDFGLSRIMTENPMKDNSSAGTPEWMAPELIRSEPFTEKCDIFSFGVIMWELATLSRPWEGVPPERVVYAVANEGSRLEIPGGPLGKLISDCWAEPQDRPSCNEILARLLECEHTLC